MMMHKKIRVFGSNSKHIANMKAHLRRTLHTHWFHLPPPIRLQTYLILARIGRLIWGPASHHGGNVQRLPFDLFMKSGPLLYAPSHLNEITAIQLVRRYTTIPTARPIDLIKTDTRSFMITSRVDGDPLGAHIVKIAEKDDKRARAKLVRNLRDLVIQLRGMPNPYCSPNEKAILCSASGGCLLDPRLENTIGGPFDTEDEFNDFLCHGARHEHRSGHDILFTHGEINMENILVKDGDISGVLDWELSGWMPEYWEYTKAHYGTWSENWLEIVEEVFEGLVGHQFPYEAEREIERELIGTDLIF